MLLIYLFIIDPYIGGGGGGGGGGAGRPVCYLISVGAYTFCSSCLLNILFILKRFDRALFCFIFLFYFQQAISFVHSSQELFQLAVKIVKAKQKLYEQTQQDNTSEQPPTYASVMLSKALHIASDD